MTIKLGDIVVGICTCQSTGESAVATGAEGADGVCVLMMYCSGAAYLRKDGSRIKYDNQERLESRNHVKKLDAVCQLHLWRSNNDVKLKNHLNIKKFS